MGRKFNYSRTLTEILKEADSSNDLQGLINLWNEIANNKYQYPMYQIRFANEHIRELALKVDGSDLEKGKFYMALREMYESEVVS